MSSSSSSAYAFKPGGSLKFKGGDDATKKHKKSKKSRSSLSSAHKEKERRALTEAGELRDGNEAHELAAQEDGQAAGASGSGSAAAEPSASGMTDAERRFQETRMKRLKERAAKEAKRSHKDKVDEFNKYLEAQTDHFDLPRIGPG